MSKETFHNFGVPHYADTDTPAIRPKKKPRDLPKFMVERKARKMAAMRYVREFIQKEWKEDKRFEITAEPQTRWDFTWKKNVEKVSDYAGQKGTFKELKLNGLFWMVQVEWDDPEFKSKTGKMISMFEFYHFAFEV